MIFKVKQIKSFIYNFYKKNNRNRNFLKIFNYAFDLLSIKKN